MLSLLLTQSTTAADSPETITTPAKTPPPPADQVDPTPPTTEARPDAAVSAGVKDIVRLVQGGVSPQVILEFIHQTQHKYRLTADDILYLNQNKVPSEIMGAMLQKHILTDGAAAALTTPPPTVPPAAVLPMTSLAPTPPTYSPIVQTVYTPYPYPVYRESVSPYFAPTFYFPFRYSYPTYHYPVRAYWQSSPHYSTYANVGFHSLHTSRPFTHSSGFRHR